MNLARASDLSLFFQPFLTKLAICTNQLFLSNRHTSLLFSTPAFIFLPSMLSFLNHPFSATILNFLHTNHCHTTNFMVFLYNIVNTLKQHSSVEVILFSTFARFYIFFWNTFKCGSVRRLFGKPDILHKNLLFFILFVLITRLKTITLTPLVYFSISLV